MEFNIIPYQSVGNIELGKNKKEILNNISINLDERKTDSPSIVLADDTNEGITIEYENNICISIGISKPSKAIYNGIDLLNLSLKQIIDIFSKKEEQILTDGVNLLLLDSGLNFFFLDMDIESYPRIVNVYINGMYDDFLFMFKEFKLI